ncbi:hypothetical protein [Aporhodopirellula aestuarii]|uniref:Uncharacterized protein n=1 Tax=Aporhodopirellula aestuarii TaxID=2950107 RepID=A0ABT0UCC7_9BACT|nr:hypothetical protein [Aporhodopirellula aestuarii]MCM2373991.1 hypothetical protein [Aporhodopirellula aestuarii]
MTRRGECLAGRVDSRAFGVVDRRDALGGRFGGELGDAAMEVLVRARFRVPDDRKARDCSRRFASDGESYLKFLVPADRELASSLTE